MISKNSCSYCAEMQGDVEGSFFLSEVAISLGVSKRDLLTSKSFLVFPSVGALVPGHILIAPKRHITAMARLMEPELTELKDLVKFLAGILSEIYGKKIILMEHGTLFDRCYSGACVSHAHFHLMPSEISLLDFVQFNRIKVDIDKLNREQIKIDYLLYSDDCDSFFYSEADSIISQYFRKEIFERMNLTGYWNWVIDQRINEMMQTIVDIQKYLEQPDVIETWKNLKI
ncbi:HIT family protein [Methylomonas sp. MED-D]|uniref:HIT family protein n=1 Tax=unclassified Methylomonas TaxID=2608980 RepID=UPI0028A3A645|nr:HIT domain-containing protein [Methylomonas sp. MV1]MDT4328800.1 HIT domain-containing protein [Methylomonas sp. MV1]